jgi:predicted CopG family antitoxin
MVAATKTLVVSEQVYQRLLGMKKAREEDLGRLVTMTEVLEALLADQWTGGQQP